MEALSFLQVYGQVQFYGQGMVVKDVPVEEREIVGCGSYKTKVCQGKGSLEKKLAEDFHDKAVNLYAGFLWKIVMKILQLICLSFQSMDFQELKVDGSD